MKLFGIEFITKKDLETKINAVTKECESLKETFPFVLGQIVYDVSLKNEKGKYTKTKPSFEHSIITEVIVTEKNYFSLVARLKRNDVFFTYRAAKEYLTSICK